ncbi:AAA family ATPase [Streptomyces sp. NPDC015131]|uniref:AAA family ATPase n=1 Tax=Streptomyces sp. NPDC015131 TaxID=3364941 RepID=UPI0037034A07
MGERRDTQEETMGAGGGVAGAGVGADGGITGAGPGVDRGAGPSRPGLRGREAEVGQLTALVRSVRDGDGSALALLLGEPGIGKTALLAEAAAIAREHGFLVSEGRAEELHELAPLASLASGLLHGDPPLLPPGDFARLAGHHDQRIWLVERMAQLIEERTAGTPVLIAIDDVQWADPLSRFALNVLPARLRTSPVLWLLAGREDPDLRGDGTRATRIPLRPLPGEALAELARDVLGGDRPVPATVARLLDGSGGNPFLATEMLAGLAAPGPDGVHGLRDSDGAPGLRDPDGVHGLRDPDGVHGLRDPDGVHGFRDPDGTDDGHRDDAGPDGLHGPAAPDTPAAETARAGRARAAGAPEPQPHDPAAEPPQRLVIGVRARLATLRPGTLDLLRVGSVLGRAFRFADAAALCGRPTAGLLGELREALATGLLDDDGEQLVFRHDLLRQAVYADLAPSARRALHREAARHLVAMGRAAADAVPHLLKSAQPGDHEAVELLGRAAADVRAVMPDLAADLALRALELVPPHDPRLYEAGERAIAALTRAGRYRRAREVADGLLAQLPPLDVFARLQSVLGDALWHLDDIHELDRRSRAALAVATDPAISARLTARQALAQSRGPDLPAARATGERALAEAERAGDREARVAALWGLGEIALNAGDCAAAVDHHTALSAFDAAFLPEEIVARIHQDDLDRARRLLAAADGEPPRPALLMWAQGTLDLGLGRLDDAETGFVTVERLEAEIGVPNMLVNVRVLRAGLALARGDRRTAGEHLDTVRTAVAERPNPGNNAVRHYLEAVIADADGNHPAAADHLRSVQHDNPFVRWRLLRTHFVDAVKIALRAGDRPLAQDLTAQAAGHAARNPSVPTPQGIAAHTAALVHADRALLERSVRILGTGPRPLHLAAASADLGRALLRAGDTAAAAPALTTAYETYVRAGAGADADRVRTDLERARARARTGARRRATAPPPQHGWDALTASERKVARLIAAGHTNRSAAAVLVISPHTVNTHLASVFRKLAVTSRVRLARLVPPEDEPL